VCAARKHLSAKPFGDLQPVFVHYIGQTWAMDIVGPLPVTENGKRFILVAVEYLTGWPEAWSLPTVTSKEVCAAIIDLITTHGVPERLLSDNGSNLISAAVKELCAAFRIDKIQTTTYHPQGNGKVERLNKTITECLAKLVRDPELSAADWELVLPFALASIRSAVSSTTGFSPFYLMHGYDMRSVTDNKFPVLNSPGWINPSSYAVELRNRVAVARTLALRHLESARERQKKAFDSSHRSPTLRPGDLVMLRVEGHRPKLDARYTLDRIPFSKLLDPWLVAFVPRVVMKTSTSIVSSCSFRLQCVLVPIFRWSLCSLTFLSRLLFLRLPLFRT
jgi:hypothetical protein